jgi:hypothetical protein
MSVTFNEQELIDVTKRLTYLDRLEEWPEIQKGVSDERLGQIIMIRHTISGGSGGGDMRDLCWNAVKNGTDLHIWFDEDDLNNYETFSKEWFKRADNCKRCTKKPDYTLKDLLKWCRLVYKIPYPGGVIQGSLF